MNNLELSNADGLDESFMNIGGIVGFKKMQELKKSLEEKAKADAKPSVEAESKSESQAIPKSQPISSTTDTSTATSTPKVDVPTSTTPVSSDVRLANPNDGKILGMPKAVAIGLGILILGVGGFFLYKKFKK